jgi:hypothetical protein
MGDPFVSLFAKIPLVTKNPLIILLAKEYHQRGFEAIRSYINKAFPCCHHLRIKLFAFVKVHGNKLSFKLVC